MDIDAITSAKSLGDAMRILAPQLEGLVSQGMNNLCCHLEA